jgi:hypothetical protein
MRRTIEIDLTAIRVISSDELKLVSGGMVNEYTGDRPEAHWRQDGAPGRGSMTGDGTIGTAGLGGITYQ